MRTVSSPCICSVSLNVGTGRCMGLSLAGLPLCMMIGAMILRMRVHGGAAALKPRKAVKVDIGQVKGMHGCSAACSYRSSSSQCLVCDPQPILAMLGHRQRELKCNANVLATIKYPFFMRH